jgi:hypothetical protein
MHDATDTGTWQGVMHGGGVDGRGQMIWHFGPLESCWCYQGRVTAHYCNHVCTVHPARPTQETDHGR